MRDLGMLRRLGVMVLTSLLTLVLPLSAAAVKPRAVLILPFDTTTLDQDHQWMGEGVAQSLSLGLAQHPAFVQIDRSRVRSVGQPEAWGEPAVVQVARGVRAEAALFGQITSTGGEVVVRPRLLELRPGAGESIGLEPLTMPEGEFLARVAELPLLYARTLRVALTEAEAARIEKASRPTRSLRAFELFARGQAAALRGGQEGLESAADLLSRAIETDPNFVVGHYTLGVVHQSLSNRWKAAAQFRAATQLDGSYPEPFKALGDLFLAAPRRLFDQAVEAYMKAIELRPFYADAHVGLGDAKAAKGDIDGAIGAYQKALVFNPVNPRVHVSLGKIYYAEKGLYYESVTAYKRAIDLDTQSIEARMGLGEVYEDKGLYREAINEYRRVIEVDSKHTGAMYNLALVYEKVDPREAIVQWERYIALASQLAAEKDWVDVARQHLRKLKSQIKD
ncbi:MAG: tetratricopeptide repeat protein [Candidatus Rokubacteria bacterium]|nr:tetratricopeptide repeat protein [Candidatus Rokubacteria bacterium]